MGTLKTLLAAIAACLRIFVVGYFRGLSPYASADAVDRLIRGLNGKNPENPEEDYRPCLLEMLDDELTHEDIEKCYPKRTH